MDKFLRKFSVTKKKQTIAIIFFSKASAFRKYMFWGSKSFSSKNMFMLKIKKQVVKLAMCWGMLADS